MRKRENIKIPVLALFAVAVLSPSAARPQTISAVQQPVSQSGAKGPSVIHYTDYSMPPQMSVNMQQQTQGFRSPSTYALGVREPKVVYSKTGVPFRVEEPRDGSFGTGTSFYLSLGYSGYSTFVGEPMYSNLTYFPVNNDRHGSLGKPSVVSAGLGAESSYGPRVEIGVSMMSGLRYAHSGMVAFNQLCSPGIENVQDNNEYKFCDRSDYGISGGGINSTNFSVNVFYDVSEFFEEYLDHRIRPYIGGNIGLAFNTVDDYTVFDSVGYGVAPIPMPYGQTEIYDDNVGFYYADGILRHFGMTTRALSWGLEVGVGLELASKTKLDVYWRRSDWGRVASGAEMATSYYLIETMYPLRDINDQLIVDSFGYPQCPDPTMSYYPATGFCEIDLGQETDYRTDAAEVGRIAYSEFGLRLRLHF